MGQSRSEVQYIRPSKWGEYQGYRKRGPTWIKNHVKLLDNPKYTNLTLNQRAILHGLWLLTARTGKALPLDTRFIGAQLTADCRATGVALKELLSLGFIELCEESVAMVATECEQSVAQRAETENREHNPPAPNGAGPPKPKRVMGTRLPDDWMPAQRTIEILRTKGFDDDGWKRELETFRDYWTAESGQRAAKRDWDAAFRVWCGKVPASKRTGALGAELDFRGGRSGPHNAQPASFAVAAARVLAKDEERKRRMGDGAEHAGFRGGDLGGQATMLPGPETDDP